MSTPRHTRHTGDSTTGDSTSVDSTNGGDPGP
jgi:hypothetical protein